VQPHRLGTAPGLVAEVLALGATLHRVEVPAPTGRRDVVLTLPTLADRRASRNYVGASIGRYANRIRGGRFELDGHEYPLPVNDRGNTLHGGPRGFDRHLWTVLSEGPDHVELRLVSAAGDQGFPGTLEVTARFEVRQDANASVLRTDYVATADAPTPVNLTSHVYFNLDSAAPPVSHASQRLVVPAHAYLPVDDTGLPTGLVASVAGTEFDLRSPRPLRDAPPLDHTFVIPGQGLRLMAVLESSSRDLRLELHSDQPGVHVFTGAGMGAGGADHPQEEGGVALEPQHFPDSVNHPDWPSTVLRPGEEYRWVSEARFSPGLGWGE
jgi:galactose mutarotase-like enzyme